MDPVTTPQAEPELAERDRRILEFERQWWRFAGSKEQAIRDQFDLSAVRYYQVLNALIDDPAALAADPVLVKRLRRQRSARQEARSARRAAAPGPSQPGAGYPGSVRPDGPRPAVRPVP